MEEEKDSGQTSYDDQLIHQAETVHGESPIEIHNAQYEVCGNDVDHSTVSQWASR